MVEEQANSSDPLAKKAEELKQERDYIDKTVFSEDQRSMSGELSMVDQYEADIAPTTQTREFLQGVRQILDKDLGQVEDAQRRREQGLYGICERCGREIAPARLQALPQATLCIDCQRAVEAERGR